MNKQETDTHRVPKPLEAYRTDLELRENKSVNSDKAADGTFSAMRENLALNWFLSRDEELIRGIMQHVMCMDLNKEEPHAFIPFSGSRFKYLPEENKQRAELLHQNKEVVTIILHTIFQWMGSNVGKEHIMSLSKVLENRELLDDYYNHWESRQVLCPNCNKGTERIFKDVPIEERLTCTGCNVDFHKDWFQAGKPGRWRELAQTHHGGIPFPVK